MRVLPAYIYVCVYMCVFVCLYMCVYVSIYYMHALDLWSPKRVSDPSELKMGVSCLIVSSGKRTTLCARAASSLNSCVAPLALALRFWSHGRQMKENDYFQ